MTVETLAIKNLESKVDKLDNSMAQMANALASFMSKQAVLDERYLHLLETSKTQRDEITNLRNIVMPLAEKVGSNNTSISFILKVLFVILTSGAAGSAATKMFGL